MWGGESIDSDRSGKTYFEKFRRFFVISDTLISDLSKSASEIPAE